MKSKANKKDKQTLSAKYHIDHIDEHVNELQYSWETSVFAIFGTILDLHFTRT